jgi:hypothetical protein
MSNGFRLLVTKSTCVVSGQAMAHMSFGSPAAVKSDEPCKHFASERRPTLLDELMMWMFCHAVEKG